MTWQQERLYVFERCFSAEGHRKGHNMKLLTSALAACLAVPSLAITAPAVARTGVTIDFGNVGIGYRDGYYDRGHRYTAGHTGAMLTPIESSITTIIVT
jgi:hypothetical protein